MDHYSLKEWGVDAGPSSRTGIISRTQRKRLVPNILSVPLVFMLMVWVYLAGRKWRLITYA